MKIEKIIVKEDYVGKRVDYASAEILNISRNYTQNLILKNNILINDKICSKNQKLKLNDVIKIIFPDPENFKILKEEIPLDVVYEDKEILVINKQRGMVVHPAPGNFNHTLVNALLWHCNNNLSSIGGVLRPGIVHRIDKNTTGLLAVAKTDAAFKSLSSQIKNHTLKREYQAIVHGKFKEKQGSINLPIGRNFKDRKKMAVNFKNGKEAITHFKVLKEYKNFTHLAVKLETGRTHQIRVHMAYLNHPVAGDEVYGFKKDATKYDLKFGQCLHASSISIFHHKLNKIINLKAKPDEYFLDFLNKCQKEI